MIDPTDLAEITVEEFWQDFHWFGRPPKAEVQETVNQEAIDWMRLEVAGFLIRANWSGQASIEPQPTLSSEPLPLTIPVSEYFQSLPWWGQSAKPATPVARRPQPFVNPTPGPMREFNANDLSNLF